VIKLFANRFRVDEYKEYFEKMIKNLKLEMNSDFERRGVDTMIQFYKFIEDHYIFDPPQKTRYKLVDKVMDSIFSIEPIEKLSKKTLQTIKKLKS
ncbi:hypothetical protein KC678_05255, partial [Candidatus Dojkabacteria bacterium]|nr:hypothetical protein [Candidatus Dojkabacteria bacterium]